MLAMSVCKLQAMQTDVVLAYMPNDAIHASWFCFPCLAHLINPKWSELQAASVRKFVGCDGGRQQTLLDGSETGLRHLGKKTD